MGSERFVEIDFGTQVVNRVGDARGARASGARLSSSPRVRDLLRRLLHDVANPMLGSRRVAADWNPT